MNATFLRLYLILFLFLLSNPRAQATIDSLSVPIDHHDPLGEQMWLYYEFAADFKPDLPTVFAIADGQQFWARPGRAQRFQDEFFGKDMNVLVFWGRATSEEIFDKVIPDGVSTNWKVAFQLLNSNQWIEDIECVRRRVLGSRKVNLYGRSGGGLLLLEYLTRYGHNVDKAFCQTAVIHTKEIELGYSHDRFWEEIHAYNPNDRTRLLNVLKNNSFSKDDIMLTFQRQNFFVSAENIHEQRSLLIDILHSNETAKFDSLKNAYQVESVKRMKKLSQGITSAVRLYEFHMPYYDLMRADQGKKIRPNIAAHEFYTRELVALYEKGEIGLVKHDFDQLRDIESQVLIFAARWDHTVDYRGQFYLAGLIPNSILFMADDNHVFSRIYGTDHYKTLVQGALLLDKGSEKMDKLLDGEKALRWTEW